MRRGNDNLVVVGEVSQANPTTAHTLAKPVYVSARLIDRVRSNKMTELSKVCYPQDSKPLSAGQEARS